MILLTGGAGFIGSCFLKLLNNKGYTDIVVVDHLGNSEKWKNLVGKKFLEYFDRDEFLNFFYSKKFSNYRFEAIFHLGACTNTFENDVNYLIQNNYKYSITLANYALEKEIPFIYASSAATYGKGELGYDDNLIVELKPLNPYGFSKYLFDCWVAKNNYDKLFTGLRFFNVFGPNEYHKKEMASVAYKAYLQAKTTKTIKLFKSNSPDFADGEQKRDFIYVFDAIELTWLLYQKKAKGIFNIGTGKARTWNDLANSIFNAMDIPNGKIDYIEMPSELQDQYQNFTQANIDKLISRAYFPSR